MCAERCLTDSPHNASFGLATVPPGRLAGVRLAQAAAGARDTRAAGGGSNASNATLHSVSLRVTHRHLVLTADAEVNNRSNSSVGVTVRPATGAGQPLTSQLIHSVTNAPIALLDRSGKATDLSELIGHNCTLEFVLHKKARMYSFGFAD